MVTLWLIAILAMLSVAVSHHLSVELRLVKYHIAQAQAAALARGGVRYGIELLRLEQKDDQPAHDWLGDDWAIRPEANGSEEDPAAIAMTVPTEIAGREAAVTVWIRDEERTVDVNRAIDPFGEYVLQRLVGAEVVPPIADYIDEDSTPRDPGGVEEQLQATPAYRAKNNRIVAREELAAIPGITPQILERLRTLTSPFPKDPPGRLNVNTTGIDVLRAVFDASGNPSLAGLADKLVEFRWDPGDGDPATGARFTQLSPAITVLPATTPVDDGLAKSLAEAMLNGSLKDLLSAASDRFVVTVTAASGESGPAYRIEAVIDRGAVGTTRPTILSWREGGVS